MTLLPAFASSSSLAMPLVPRVYVNSQRRYDLVALEWTALGSPTFGRGELAVAPRGLWGDLTRFLPPIGSHVQLVCSMGNAATFETIVDEHSLRLDEDGETAIAILAPIITTALTSTLLGRHHLAADGRILHQRYASLAFNTTDETQCSTEPNALRHACCLFDSSDDSRPWSVGEALNYLFARDEAASLGTPSRGELLSLAGDIELAPTTLTGKTLSQAIESLAAQASLSIAGEGMTLRFYRPGLDGRYCRVELQPTGETFDPSQTNLARAAVTVSARPAQPSVYALGAPRRYESTFTLSAAWEDDSQLTYAQTVRSRGEQWEARRDLLRYWILNEDGADKSLPAFDCSTVHDDFTLSRMRQFHPPLFVPDDGSRPKLLVEYRAESTDEWTPYPGSVVASRERCAIRLDDDELPGDYFQAAASGTAELRITAAIDSDAVLSVHLEGDRNAPDVILQHKRNAHYDEILDSSKHHDPAIVRDDTPRLRQLAIAEAAHTTRPSRATLALATLDPAFRTGDLVPRIGGRGLSLSCRANRAPAVVRAHHDFVNQQTILELQG